MIPYYPLGVYKDRSVREDFPNLFFTYGWSNSASRIFFPEYS